MLTPSDLKGKVLICKTPCESCPYIGGPKAIKLRRGRLAQITRETVQGGQFHCHKAIYEHGHRVLCRGWDARVNPNATRMAERFGILMDVELSELPVKTAQEREKFLSDMEDEDNVSR